MNQYQRLLTAADTTQKPVVNQSETNSKPINNKPKAYVYVSGVCFSRTGLIIFIS
jgi:hypothetical protein